jgi:sec-independent protein translocase protein TatA
MTLLFLNIGGGEVVLIVLVVLLFFGSKNIPSLAKGLGKAMREFKEASDGIKREIEESAKPVSTTLDQMHDGWNKTVEDVKKETAAVLEPIEKTEEKNTPTAS